MSSALELVFIFNSIFIHFLADNFPSFPINTKLSHKFLMKIRWPEVWLLFIVNIWNMVDKIIFDLACLLHFFFIYFLLDFIFQPFGPKCFIFIEIFIWSHSLLAFSLWSNSFSITFIWWFWRRILISLTSIG